jgi:5-methylcytosine-specific restriction enzyme A
VKAKSSSSNAIRYSRVLGRVGVEQRRRIRVRDNYTCRMCRRPVRIGEVDHIIALENGGTNDDDNQQLLCIECHKVKTAIDRGYVLKSGSSEDGTPTDTHHHWNR